MKGLIARFNKDSHLQRIKASYLDDKVKLTEYENELFEKLRFIYSHRLGTAYTKQKTIEKVMEEYDISQATAYRYYNQAMYIFGEIDSVDIRAEKNILAELYLDLHYQLKKRKKFAEAQKALDSYRELFDFSQAENEADPDKIKANEYLLFIPKEITALMKERSSKGLVDMNWTAKEVGFEDISNGEDQEQ